MLSLAFGSKDRPLDPLTSSFVLQATASPKDDTSAQVSRDMQSDKPAFFDQLLVLTNADRCPSLKSSSSYRMWGIGFGGMFPGMGFMPGMSPGMVPPPMSGLGYGVSGSGRGMMGGMGMGSGMGMGMGMGVGMYS